MNYFKTRKKYLLNNIFNKAISNNDLLLMAVVFNKRAAEYEVYRFESNKYKKSFITNEEWTNWEYLEGLSWEQLYNINKNLIVININEYDHFMEDLKKSYKYKTLRNMYNFIFS